MTSLTRGALYFTGPSAAEIRQEAFEGPGAGELLVHVLRTGISAGSELLVYRGMAPPGMAADLTLPALAGDLSFPLKYGYAAVGRVVEIGPDLDPGWIGRFVFSFQPHQTHFVAAVADVIPLPPNVGLEEGVFLANMETAVGLVHDGRPMAGERAVIFGQGIVGLLTTALLSRASLIRLVTLDRLPKRRETSLALGAHASLDPVAPDVEASLLAALRIDEGPTGADLTYELSGDPSTLDRAIAATGDAGRIVIGSWYGGKKAEIDLGGRFHRGRLQLISSQVSRLAPEISGRWTKARRLSYVMTLLTGLRPSSLITHRVPFEQAPHAYRLLDQNPADALQIVLTYPDA